MSSEHVKKKKASGGESRRERASSQPMTSKRAMEEDSDEEDIEEEEPSKLMPPPPPPPPLEQQQQQGSNKRKSKTKLELALALTDEESGGDPAAEHQTKKQKSQSELSELKRIMKEDQKRPLFFRLRYKPPESVVQQILRKALKSSPNLTSWGVLEFYQGKNHISSYELSNNAPILINGRIMLNLESEPAESIAKYTDWEHSLSDGFWLQRLDGAKSMVTFKRAHRDNGTNYKVFSSTREFFVNSGESRTIYDGNEALTNMHTVQDIRSAYDYSKTCCLQIAILGKYMTGFGIYQTISQTLDRDMIVNMPYWLLLKVQPEFQELDKHLLRSIKMI